MTNELVTVFDDFFNKHNHLVGFNDLFKDFDDLNIYKTTTFPPYDMYKADVVVVEGKNATTETHTYIDVATAGYNKAELNVTYDKKTNQVEVTGAKDSSDTSKTYTYKGIASRNFQLKWKLQPSLEFLKCSYNDGILQLEFRTKDQPEDEALQVVTIE